ncbi:AAA family ATPase [Actinocrispum sp. NPDC049592]|uniref:ATP-binding protein n=1 Tax=Actinocrispum sp. NPDC049592 TaxID=3154835 RepID=UPI00343C169A
MGRQTETTALHQVLDRLATGRPQVVEIYGDPGIGKTRLLDELAGLATDRKLALLAARSSEYQQHIPFGVVTEALSGLGSRDELATPQSSDRYRAYRSVREVLIRHAQPPGLALLFDDLHWADEASHDLLEQLLLDMPPVALLVAVAYRDHHVPPGLPAAFTRTRADVTRLALEPLTESDIAELSPDLPVRRLRLVLRASGGNPLYLDALGPVDDATLEVLADQDRADPRDIPGRLHALLDTELRRLDPVQRLVAQAIAIAGDPAELDLVLGIADRPEAEVFPALDALVALGVVHPAGFRFRFRHPLLRMAAYQSAGPAWRICAHRRAELHLRSRGGSLPLRAHHLSRAARYGDTDVAGVLVQAAVETLGTAPADSAVWTRTALRLLPPDADTTTRTDLLLLQADALGRSEGLAESRRILHEVIEHAGPRRWEAVLHCATADRLLGRLDEARALLETELGEAVPAAGRGALTIELAATNLLLDDPQRCIRHATAAVADGLRIGERCQVASGRVLLGMASLRDGDVVAARHRLTEAARLVDGLSDAELREWLSILPMLAWLELHLERYPDADRHLARGLEIAHTSGLARVLPYLYTVRSALAERTGRLDVACSALVDARDASAAIGSTETNGMAGAVELWVTLWHRGPQAALDLADGARPRSRWWAEEADAARVTALLIAGRPTAAATQIAEHLQIGKGGLTNAHWYSSLALAELALGARDEAVKLSEDAVRFADELDVPYQRGITQMAYARVLAGCGQHGQALAQAELAVDWFVTAGAPLHAAMAHGVVAENLAASGDLQRARVEFGLAKSGYAACGATWLLTKVRNSESRLGARTPRPRRAGEAGTVEVLSDREREIAQLVANGMTNREIAARLYLSAKTVEGHLARVFTKLDVKSRVGVAQRLAAAAT